MSIKKQAGKSEFTFSMKQYPFYYDGMSVEEWNKELQYYCDHFSDIPKGKYIPMWKQKIEKTA